ncbi:hypothetical protein O181_052222 [Austropuccinia psidii MF-1]|uniref:Integrase zinc-binding domain-containing protein n=1 Tax=Austropuccinia psidii MF-1 TaxID=1389203 RepID=A0A9Q3E774_9BASI|nr:hypothetical protein [Austropuccinia psidii MF-1]
MGHMSEDRTRERIVSTAWWPKWAQELSEYIHTCERCQKANRNHGKKGKCSGSQTHRGISRKHPVFPVSLVKPYFQTEEDNFPSRKKNPTPPEIVELEDSPGHLNKSIKALKIRLNGKDQRQYMVRFKSHTAEKDKWLAEDEISNWNIHLTGFKASRSTGQSHK